MTTEEKNKLIAEFMGMKYGEKRKWSKEEGWTHTNESLDRFRTDWNWVMSVWKKIKSNLSDNNVLYMSSLSAIADVNISKTFELMVEAVQWYNQQHK